MSYLERRYSTFRPRAGQRETSSLCTTCSSQCSRLTSLLFAFPSTTYRHGRTILPASPILPHHPDFLILLNIPQPSILLPHLVHPHPLPSSSQGRDSRHVGRPSTVLHRAVNLVLDLRWRLAERCSGTESARECRVAR